MRKDVLPAFGFAFLGLVVGLAVFVLAAGMSGAGHGWASAGVSTISVIAAPLTGIAWGFRRHRWSVWLSLLLIVTAIVFDFILLLATKAEGYYYVERVLSAMSDRVVLWALLFVSWQLWALATAATTLRINKRRLGKEEP